MDTFEFEISLRLFDFSTDPVEISNRLCLNPKWIRRKGDPRKDKRGNLLGGNYDSNYCSFPLQKRRNEDLESLLDRVTGYLENHRDLFVQIRDEGGRSEFFVGWYSAGNSGITFCFSLMSRLGGLGVDLTLDIYAE